MVSFEESREKRKSAPGRRPQRRDSGNIRNFGGSSKGGNYRTGGRGVGKGPSRFGKRDTERVRTKVTCSDCGQECEVPFKPTSDKPMYCNACFGKREKPLSSKTSEIDFDKINEKLNKIMKALKIE